MNRLRIAVIGLGWFGEIHCEAIVGIPHLELAALCTRTPDRLQALAGKFGVKKATTDYRELLADPDIDAVSIVTMWDQHTEPAVAALAAGKHVFLEKPIASTVADCRQIIAAAKTSKGILQVGHICRFNPRYRAAKQAIAEGTHRPDRVARLAPQHPGGVDADHPQQDRPDRRRCHPRHRPDAVVHRDRVVSAYAQTVDVRGLKHPDIGQTMYRFAGGATATLETVWCMPEKTPYDIDERMNIVGTEGFIQIQDTFPNLGIAGKDKFHSPDTTYWPMFEGARGGALKEEFSYFADCALKGVKPAIGTPEDAMAALQATLAAEELARTGQVIRIEVTVRAFA